jgi:S-adenosylmethionine:tRNA ribosyltransferase-isomerase
MRPATEPRQRPPEARLLVVAPDGSLRHTARAELAVQLGAGDLLVANDAATIPASLRGVHEATGAPIEVRLAGRRSLMVHRVERFTAIVFGAGDHRIRTEDRQPPPPLRPGDDLVLGPIRAGIVRLLGHPRLVELRFHGTPDAIWSGIARHGRPIQYAHVPEPLALWDVWTKVAALPVAFEAPSAGFAVDWRLLGELRARDVGFASITLAAGISSTGDPELDARLPLDEAYHVPPTTARAVARARSLGGRVIALGTTVTRALEHAATGAGRVRAGTGVATRRIGPETPLHVVDAVVTGIHEPGDSHYELLRALAPEEVLCRAAAAAERAGYRSHEFGDSMLVERQRKPRDEGPDEAVREDVDSATARSTTWVEQLA